MIKVQKKKCLFFLMTGESPLKGKIFLKIKLKIAISSKKTIKMFSESLVINPNILSLFINIRTSSGI